jgi:hypothetical protein
MVRGGASGEEIRQGVPAGPVRCGYHAASVAVEILPTRCQRWIRYLVVIEDFWNHGDCEIDQRISLYDLPGCLIRRCF